MTVWYFVFFRSFVNEELAVLGVCSDKKLPAIFQPVPAGMEAGLEKVLSAGRVSPPGSSDPADLCLLGSSGSGCGKSLLGFFWLWSRCCFRLIFTIRVIFGLSCYLHECWGLTWFGVFFSVTLIALGFQGIMFLGLGSEWPQSMSS